MASEKGLVAVARYHDVAQAELARSLLESEGIPAFVAYANHVRMEWWLAPALGGVRVEVPAGLRDAARALLDAAPVAPDALPAEEPPEARDRCPRCGSEDLAKSRLERRTKGVSMLLAGFGLVLPFGAGAEAWRCTACGHAFRVPRPWRGPLRVAGAALALAVLLPLEVLRGVFLALRRLVLFVFPGPTTRREFACWQCGATYIGGDAACAGCGVPLPGVEASQELVVPGKAYDGACARCHTPYALADYDPGSPRWLCSFCRSPVPRSPD